MIFKKYMIPSNFNLSIMINWWMLKYLHPISLNRMIIFKSCSCWTEFMMFNLQWIFHWSSSWIKMNKLKFQLVVHRMILMKSYIIVVDIVCCNCLRNSCFHLKNMNSQLINSILLEHLFKVKLCLNCNFKLFEWLFFNKNMNLLWQ